MTECFYEIKPIIEDFQLATQIKEAEKLGSPKIPRVGNIKEVLSLIDNL